MVYGRIRYPLPLVSIPEEPGRYVLRDARASVSTKKTFAVRFEPESSTTSNVKGVTYCAIRSITQARVILTTIIKSSISVIPL